MKVIVLLVLTAGMAIAQTNAVHFDVLHTLDGANFTNATVTRMNAAFVLVTIDTGGARVAFTNLPTIVQQEFGFDQAQAQAEIDLEQRKKQESQRLQANAIKAQQEAAKDRKFRFVDGKLVPISDFTNNLDVKVTQVLQNGILGELGVFMYFRPIMDDGLYQHRTVFIRCPTNGIVDGQEWQGFCCRAGTFDSPRIIMGRDLAFRRRKGCEYGSSESCGSLGRRL
jgi:hypothetical protein